MRDTGHAAYTGNKECTGLRHACKHLHVNKKTMFTYGPPTTKQYLLLSEFITRYPLATMTYVFNPAYASFLFRFQKVKNRPTSVCDKPVFFI